MHPVLTLLLHLAVLCGAQLVLLFVLLFTTGTSVQAGERAVMTFLVVSALAGLATCVSLHLRLPDTLSLPAKLGLDLLGLLGAAAMLIVLGLGTVIVFNR